MRIVIYHSEYVCDSGCCGHVIKLNDDREKFVFSHPYTADKTTWRAWAEDLIREEFGEEHVADLDWEHCQIFDD